MKIRYLKPKILLIFAYSLLVLIAYKLKIGCIFQRLLHITCPGCGMTRAVFSALKFDFAAAFDYHLMFWSVPVLLLYFLFDGNLFKNRILNKVIFFLIAIGFLMNWVLKFNYIS